MLKKISILIIILFLIPGGISIDYNVMKNVTFHPVDTTAYYRINESSYYNTSIEVNRTCVIIDGGTWEYCNQTGNIDISFVAGTTTTSSPTTTTLYAGIELDFRDMYNRTDPTVKSWFDSMAMGLFYMMLPYNTTHNISIFYNLSSKGWDHVLD